MLFSNGTINNNTISNNTWGIICGDYSSPLITFNNITYNTYGIECRNNSNPIIHWNNIHNNPNYGVINYDTNFNVSATDNWWGDPSGPYDPSPGQPDWNRLGKGDRVSDYVYYRPWEDTPIEEAGPG